MDYKNIMNIRENRTSEKWIEKALGEYVSRHGGASVKMGDRAKNGLPDRLVLWPGGVAEFIELKSTGKRMSHIQRTVRALLVQMGFRYTVIDSETSLVQWQNLHREHIRRK